MSSDSLKRATDEGRKSAPKMSFAPTTPSGPSSSSSPSLTTSIKVPSSLEDQIRDILEADDSPRAALRPEELLAAKRAVVTSSASDPPHSPPSTSKSEPTNEEDTPTSPKDSATRVRTISRKGASRRLPFIMSDENVVADLGSDSSWFVEHPIHEEPVEPEKHETNLSPPVLGSSPPERNESNDIKGELDDNRLEPVYASVEPGTSPGEALSPLTPRPEPCDERTTPASRLSPPGVSLTPVASTISTSTQKHPVLKRKRNFVGLPPIFAEAWGALEELEEQELITDEGSSKAHKIRRKLALRRKERRTNLLEGVQLKSVVPPSYRGPRLKLSAEEERFTGAVLRSSSHIATALRSSGTGHTRIPSSDRYSSPNFPLQQPAASTRHILSGMSMETMMEPTQEAPASDSPLPTHSVTMEFVLQLINAYREGVALHYLFARHIVLHVSKYMERFESTVVDLTVPDGGKLVVVGDLHGQLDDLLTVFKISGFPSPTNCYIFNGDLVDRGEHSIEVLMIIYALKLVHPTAVIINRGNHEHRIMNARYGFELQVKKLYDATLYELIQTSFNWLPVACLVEESTFVVHGGLPQFEDFTIEELRRISRRDLLPHPLINTREDLILEQLLWSDPGIGGKGFMDNRRGAGILFSQDVTNNFLQRNNLHLIVRSHQMIDSGFNRCHSGQLVTVFSASKYCGTNDNLAAIAVFDADSSKLSFIQFESEPNLLAFTPTLSKDDLNPRMVSAAQISPQPSQGDSPSSGPPPSNLASNYDQTLQKLHGRILRKRHTLYMAFVQLDKKSGFITLNDWAMVMTNVIRIDLHWQALWPYLGYAADDKSTGAGNSSSQSNRTEDDIESSISSSSTSSSSATLSTNTSSTNASSNVTSPPFVSKAQKKAKRQSVSGSSSTERGGLPEFINYTKFLDMYTTFVDPTMAKILEEKQAVLVERLCRKFYERSMDLRQVFDSMDVNGDGKISYEEFCKGLKKFKKPLGLDGAAMYDLMRSVDRDTDGLVRFRDFLERFQVKFDEISEVPEKDKAFLLHTLTELANAIYRKKGSNDSARMKRMFRSLASGRKERRDSNLPPSPHRPPRDSSGGNSSSSELDSDTGTPKRRKSKFTPTRESPLGQPNSAKTLDLSTPLHSTPPTSPDSRDRSPGEKSSHVKLKKRSTSETPPPVAKPKRPAPIVTSVEVETPPIPELTTGIDHESNVTQLGDVKRHGDAEHDEDDDLLMSATDELSDDDIKDGGNDSNDGDTRSDETSDEFGGDVDLMEEDKMRSEFNLSASGSILPPDHVTHGSKHRSSSSDHIKRKTSSSASLEEKKKRKVPPLEKLPAEAESASNSAKSPSTAHTHHLLQHKRVKTSSRRASLSGTEGSNTSVRTESLKALSIPLQDFTIGIQKQLAHLHLTKKQARVLFEYMDRNRDGMLSYLEFRRCFKFSDSRSDRWAKDAVATEIQNNRNKLLKMFVEMDVEGSGQVPLGDFQAVFNTLLGRALEEEEARIMGQVSSDIPDTVDYNRFLTSFRATRRG